MSSHSQQKQAKAKIEPVKRKKFLMKPVPLYFFALLFLPLFSIAFHFYKPNKTEKAPPSAINQSTIPDNACASIIREKENSLIGPLLFVDINDDQALIPVKTKIINYIEQKKQQGHISSASVYLNDLNTASHFEINPDELYDPASIMKVSLMISYLKKAESNPELLKKRYAFTQPAYAEFKASIKDKTLVPGNSYSVEELLTFMISYSDNESFSLLANNIDKFNFTMLSNEFEIPILTDKVTQSNKKANFVANVNSISRFFRVLYNASYLNREMSQYALQLLTKCNYKDGIVKGVDPAVMVAHKFGERTKAGVSELHEFGIVYLKNRPYLLGVMTKGNNLTLLPEIVSGISAIAYSEMQTK